MRLFTARLVEMCIWYSVTAINVAGRNCAYSEASIWDGSTPRDRAASRVSLMLSTKSLHDQRPFSTAGTARSMACGGCELGRSKWNETPEVTSVPGKKAHPYLVEALHNGTITINA